MVNKWSKTVSRHKVPGVLWSDLWSPSQESLYWRHFRPFRRLCHSAKFFMHSPVQRKHAAKAGRAGEDGSSLLDFPQIPKQNPKRHTALTSLRQEIPEWLIIQISLNVSRLKLCLHRICQGTHPVCRVKQVSITPAIRTMLTGCRTHK